MKKIITTLFLASSCVTLAQAPVNWTNKPWNTPKQDNAKLGTENKRSLHLTTNDSARVVIDSLGNMRVAKLASEGTFHLVFADQNGNLTNGKPGLNFYPSKSCALSMMPWFEGGNLVGTSGSNVIGPCNAYPFVLQSNSKKALFIDTNGNIGLGENNTTPTAILDISNPDVTNNGSGVREHLKFYGDQDGTIANTGDMSLYYNGVYSIYQGQPGTATPRFFIENSGNAYFYKKLNIGTQTNSTYATLNVNTTGSGSGSVNALDVYDTYTNKINFRVKSDGFVYAREINVQPTNFPDYVFNADYKLKSLESLESYIQQNHHLPNVPSAAEIEKNGANIGDLSKIQMEKIEELTLYIIQLKKQVDALEIKLNKKSR